MRQSLLLLHLILARLQTRPVTARQRKHSRQEQARIACVGFFRESKLGLTGTLQSQRDSTVGSKHPSKTSQPNDTTLEREADQNLGWPRREPVKRGVRPNAPPIV